MAPIYLGKMVVPSSLRYIENLAPNLSAAPIQYVLSLKKHKNSKSVVQDKNCS